MIRVEVIELAGAAKEGVHMRQTSGTDSYLAWSLHYWIQYLLLLWISQYGCSLYSHKNCVFVSPEQIQGGKTATKTYHLFKDVYVFSRWQKRRWKLFTSGSLSTLKTDDNIEKIGNLVQSHRRLSIRMFGKSEVIDKQWSDLPDSPDLAPRLATSISFLRWNLQ